MKRAVADHMKSVLAAKLSGESTRHLLVRAFYEVGRTAFTKSVIKTSFVKTGIHLFSPGRIRRLEDFYHGQLDGERSRAEDCRSAAMTVINVSRAKKRKRTRTFMA